MHDTTLRHRFIFTARGIFRNVPQKSAQKRCLENYQPCLANQTFNSILPVDDACDQSGNTFPDSVEFYIDFCLKHVLGFTQVQNHSLNLVIAESTKDVMSSPEFHYSALPAQNVEHFKLRYRNLLLSEIPLLIRTKSNCSMDE